MPKFLVPLGNIDRQELTTQLGEDLCKIEVWRQPSDGHWYCSIESPPNHRIVSGRRMVLDEPVMGVTSREKPLGDFYVRSSSTLKQEPGAEPWGNTHFFHYELQ